MCRIMANLILLLLFLITAVGMAEKEDNSDEIDFPHYFEGADSIDADIDQISEEEGTNSKEDNKELDWFPRDTPIRRENTDGTKNSGISTIAISPKIDTYLLTNSLTVPRHVKLEKHDVEQADQKALETLVSLFKKCIKYCISSIMNTINSTRGINTTTNGDIRGKQFLLHKPLTSNEDPVPRDPPLLGDSPTFGLLVNRHSPVLTLENQMHIILNTINKMKLSRRTKKILVAWHDYNKWLLSILISQ